MTEELNIDPSGLNIIQNPDGSFIFEWNKEDDRWSWLNGLTDDQIKDIVELAIEKKLKEIQNDQ